MSEEHNATNNIALSKNKKQTMVSEHQNDHHLGFVGRGDISHLVGAIDHESKESHHEGDHVEGSSIIFRGAGR